MDHEVMDRMLPAPVAASDRPAGVAGERRGRRRGRRVLASGGALLSSRSGGRVGLMMMLVAALQADGVELPVYAARRAVDAIHVDGRLDERSWSLAARARAFRHIYDPARLPKFPTEAAIVWDDVHLYVAFDCTDPDPWGTMKNRDDRLWNEEVVEVFLDPDGDGLNYAELEVSPNNVVVDLLIPRPKADVEASLRWNIDGLQTAVERRAGGWIAEIAIPWKSLAAAAATAAPAPGDRWRAGLYRIKRPRGVSGGDEFLAWSVTRAEHGFHDPERFGYLEFQR